MQSSRRIPIFGEDLGQKGRYNAFPNKNRRLVIDGFAGEPTVKNHQNVSSEPGFGIAINLHLRSKPVLLSPMQMDPAAEPTYTFLPQAKPTGPVAANINMNIPPTARELKRPLQRGTNCPFLDPVSLFFFPQYEETTRDASPCNAQLMSRSPRLRLGVQGSQ